MSLITGLVAAVVEGTDEPYPQGASLKGKLHLSFLGEVGTIMVLINGIEATVADSIVRVVR